MTVAEIFACEPIKNPTSVTRGPDKNFYLASSKLKSSRADCDLSEGPDMARFCWSVSLGKLRGRDLFVLRQHVAGKSFR